MSGTCLQFQVPCANWHGYTIVDISRSMKMSKKELKVFQLPFRFSAEFCSRWTGGGWRWWRLFPYIDIQLFMKPKWMLIESQSHHELSDVRPVKGRWCESSCAHGNTQWCCLFVYAAIAQLVMWSCCSFKAMFFLFGQIAMTLENMTASSPKGTFCGWTWFQYSSGFLKSHAHNHVAPSLSTDLNKKNKKHSPDPFSLSKWKWCVHCNGNIYRHTRRFDFCFLTEFSCHILSSLLQGNSSLVDTWERCFAKLHRRKKNKHRMDHVGPSNGRLESWKLWIFQVPVEGQATKWTI